MRKLYRMLVIFCLIAVVAMVPGCKKQETVVKDERVEKAIDLLTREWSKVLDELTGRDLHERYVEIIHTTVYEIKDEITDEKKKEWFGDVDCVIEFEILSSYFGSKNPLVNAGLNDCVVITKSGQYELCQNSLFRRVMTRTFEIDFSDVIERTIDYKGEFNRVIIDE